MSETHYSEITGPNGEKSKMKLLTNIIDDKRHTFEMYMIGDDGKEFKTMEIVYTRT